MKSLTEYLLERNTAATVKVYLRDIAVFLSWLPEEQAQHATYQDVLTYVSYLRKLLSNPRTINRMLYGVKAWYDYLLETGRRQDHPCRQLTLKDAKPLPIQLQDLFKPQELEGLLQRKERFRSNGVRNKVIMSLLIYQALTLGEMIALQVADVNLSEGTLYVPQTPLTNARTLSLKSSQVMLLHGYIHQLRPRLLKEPTDALLVTSRGRAENGEGIGYLVSTFQRLFPDRALTTRTIRQSVITNLLKEGKDLRLVQAFAGHLNPSTTEKYKQTGLEELKAAVRKHHPLG